MMVRTSTLVAGLALAMTTYAMPTAQADNLDTGDALKINDDLVSAADPTVVVDDTAAPAASQAAVDGTITTSADPAVVVSDGEDPADPTVVVDDTAAPAASQTAVDDTITTAVDPQLDMTTDSESTGPAQAIALEAQIEDTQLSAQNSACSLDAQAPSTWSESGAEKLVDDYFREKGMNAWVSGLTEQITGKKLASGVSCGHRNSGTCSPIELDAECTNQSFFIARYLAASVKATFDAVGESLQDTGISGALDIKQIVEDFKLPDVPEKHDLGKTLNNVAFGVGVAEQAVGLIPGGEVVSSGLALLGIGLNAASENMEDEEPVIPEYDTIEAGMNSYLKKFFDNTRNELDRMLAALFGEIDNTSTDEPLLRQIITRMGSLGVRDLNPEAENPIIEIFKGGEFMHPITKSGFKSAFDKGFKGMQGALIGNLLSGLQVYVEREENPPESGPINPCLSLGELMIDNECYVIKRKGFNGEAPARLEDQYLEKLGSYGIDIHTLIRSTKDCDNGEADNSFTGTGQYGKCWYGLRIATRVSDELVRRYNPGVANGFACNAKYRNLDKIPSYIPDEKGNRCNGQWKEVPVYKRCTLNMFNDGTFNDRGLARYKMKIEGEGIDVGMICPYLHDGRRCAFGSNRRCEPEGNGFVMEISFAHGSLGNDHFNQCHNDLYKSFRGDNHCFEYPK